MKRGNLITILIIIGIIILSTIIMITQENNIDSEVAKCIGENSVLYVQLGCHACESQEELFGKSYNQLNVIDCWFEKDKCSNIQATPTWIINGKKYIGIQSIEKLKELTRC